MNSNRVRKFRLSRKNFIALMMMVFVVLVWSGVLWTPKRAEAAIHKYINYQGKLLDSSKIPVADGTYSIEFKIYGQAVGGAAVWTDTMDAEAQNGLFSLLLGSSSTLSLNFETENGYWLGVNVEGDGEMTPRKEIGAAAYAFNSDLLDGLDKTQTGSTSAAIVALTSNGNLTVTGDPQGGAVAQGSLYINPGAPGANETLLGIANNGSQRLLLDAEGDLTVAGYVSTTGLYIDSIDIEGQGVGNTTAGAYKVGTYDEFDWSASTNVQDVLDDLDLAITNASSSANIWKEGASYIYPASTTAEIYLASGNYLGMNTSTPSNILTIQQPADDNGLKIYGYDDMSTTYAELSLRSDGVTILNGRNGLILKSALSSVVYFGNNITPTSNAAYSLGTPALSWNNIYASGTAYVLGNGNFGGYVSTTGLYIDSIDIEGQGTGNTTAGAYKVGTFDEFDWSASTNVQDVLDDLDLAITTASSSANIWKEGASYIYPASTTANVLPSSNNAQSLGAFASAWKDLYASGTAYLTGIQNSSGTVGTPSYSFAGDTDTGMYDVADNNLGFVVAGALRLQVAPSAVTVMTTLNGQSNNSFDLGNYGNAWRNIYASSTAFLTDVNVYGNEYIFGKLYVSSTKLVFDADGTTLASSTDRTHSGAYNVGVADNFAWSASTNVQFVLEDLDLAITNASSSANIWKLGASYIYPASTTADILAGAATPTSVSPFYVDIAGGDRLLQLYKVYGGTLAAGAANYGLHTQVSSTVDVADQIYQMYGSYSQAEFAGTFDSGLGGTANVYGSYSEGTAATNTMYIYGAYNYGYQGVGATADTVYGAYNRAISAGSTNSGVYGTYSDVQGDGTSRAYGVYSTVTGGTTNYGFNASVADGAAGSNYGAYLIASDGLGSNYGVYGSVSGSAGGTSQYGAYFDVSGTDNDSNYGYYAGVTGSGNGDIAYGIYTNVFGAATNWAGYFAGGNVKIDNSLYVTSTSAFSDYVTLSHDADNQPILYFASSTFTYNPGFRLSSTTGEMEYRDENSSTWVPFDSFTNYWTDGGTWLYPTDAGDYYDTGMRVYDNGEINTDANLVVDGYSAFGTATNTSRIVNIENTATDKYSLYSHTTSTSLIAGDWYQIPSGAAGYFRADGSYSGVRTNTGVMSLAVGTALFNVGNFSHAYNATNYNFAYFGTASGTNSYVVYGLNPSYGTATKAWGGYFEVNTTANGGTSEHVGMETKIGGADINYGYKTTTTAPSGEKAYGYWANIDVQAASESYGIYLTLDDTTGVSTNLYGSNISVQGNASNYAATIYGDKITAKYGDTVYGLDIDIDNIQDYGYGVNVSIDGAAFSAPDYLPGVTLKNFGVRGMAASDTADVVGVYGLGVGKDANSVFGMIGKASGGATQYGAYLESVGQASDVTYGLNAHANTGGTGYGVYSYAQSGSGGSAYGVYAIADSTDGPMDAAYGLFASASEGIVNWAGWFGAGDVYVENNLFVSSSKLWIGTDTNLYESTARDDSGARFVGVNPDNLDWSTSTNVQFVLEDLDLAITNASSSANIWKEGASYIYPASTTANVLPSSNNAQSLGAFASAWKDFYASGTSYLTGVLNSDGALGAPSYSFAADSDTGMFWAGSGNVRFSSNGASIVTMGNSEVDVGGSILPTANNTRDLGAFSYAWRNIYASSTAYLTGIQNSAGAVGTPSYSFAGDTDTGMYSDSANSVRFAVSGANILVLRTTDILVYDDLLPSINNSKDIGAFANAWKDIYASGTAFLTDVNVYGNEYIFGKLYVSSTKLVFDADGTTLASSTDRTHSGAYNVGVADNFSWSASTNVQFVLEDFDSAITNASSSANIWKEGASYIYPASTTANVLPSSNNVQSLGAFDSAWKDLYASGTAYLTDVTAANYVNVSDTTVGYKIGGNIILRNPYTRNTLLGQGAGAVLNSDGTDNTFIGFGAGNVATSTDFNAFIGAYAGYANTIGNYNSFIGYAAGFANTTGANNSFIGNAAGQTNTTGAGNTAVGSAALFTNSTSANNTAVGNAALRYTTSANNTAVGYAALNTNSTGASNSAVGSYALYANSTGASNSAVGSYALSANTSGANNVAVGYYASLYNASATSTVAIGYQAARGTAAYSNQYGVYIGYNAGYAAQTGSDNNVMIGYQAGNSVTTGSDNILIGYDVDTPLATTSNYLNIGNRIYGSLTDGALNIQPSSDSSNYSRFATVDAQPLLYFVSSTMTNYPGFRLSSTTGEMEYRDEDASAWVPFDNFTNYWTDAGTWLYPTDAGDYGDTGMRVYDNGEINTNGNLAVDGVGAFGAATSSNWAINSYKLYTSAAASATFGGVSTTAVYTTGEPAGAANFYGTRSYAFWNGPASTSSEYVAGVFGYAKAAPTAETLTEATGIRGYAEATAGTVTGLIGAKARALNNGATVTNAYGAYVEAQDADTNNIGLFAQASGGSEQRGGYFSGIGATGDTTYGVYSEAASGDYNYGIRADASGGSYQYAGSFLATGGAGDQTYGIYAVATGGDANWAAWFVGDVYAENKLFVSSSELYINTNTYLSEFTDRLDSGAYNVGVEDNFAWSASTNVQFVLEDLDAAISAGLLWTDRGAYIDPNNAPGNFKIADTSGFTAIGSVATTTSNWVLGVGSTFSGAGVTGAQGGVSTTSIFTGSVGAGDYIFGAQGNIVYWSGTAGAGADRALGSAAQVYVTTTGGATLDEVWALYGQAKVSDGYVSTTYGVYGQSDHTGGLVDSAYGGYFTAAGGTTVNKGVSGHAEDGATQYGGQFTASGESGDTTYALYANATSVGGDTAYGVYGRATGGTTASYGIYGYTVGNLYSADSYSYAGYFDASGKATTTIGVYAKASNGTGTNYAFYSPDAGGYSYFGDHVAIEDAAVSDDWALGILETYSGAGVTGAQGGVSTTAIFTGSVGAGNYIFGAQGGITYWSGTAAATVDRAMGSAGQVYVTTTGGATLDDARGLYGYASVSGGNVSSTYGIYGMSESSGGLVDHAYGGYFDAADAANSNYGVKAVAEGGNTQYGGQFIATGASGDETYGVYAYGATGDTTYGVHAAVDGGTTAQYGVYSYTGGSSYSVDSYSYAGYFDARGAATTTIGVYASAQNGTTANYAFYSPDAGGYSYFGDHVAIEDAAVSSDLTLRIYETYSEEVSGKWQANVSSTLVFTGTATGTSYYVGSLLFDAYWNGTASATTDVLAGAYGKGTVVNTGGYGLTAVYGVYGQAQVTGGYVSTTYGVYGSSDHPSGLVDTAYGGYFKANKATTNYGVYGTATNGATQYAGYFLGTGGAGDTTYGVYATAASGATNWAGWFGSGNVYVDNNLYVSSSALYIDTDTYLSESTARTDSGARFVGVNPDNLDWSTSTNVQFVLEDLDAAISTNASLWTDRGAYIDPNNATGNFKIADTSGFTAIGAGATTSADWVLGVGATFTGNGVAGGYGAVSSTAIYTGTATTQFALNGHRVSAIWDGGGGAGAQSVYGTYSRGIVNSVSADQVDELAGVYGLAQVNGGNVTSSVGVAGYANINAGLVDTAIGGYFRADGGTRNYGVMAVSPGNAGDYAFYSDDGDGDSAFRDNVLVGGVVNTLTNTGFATSGDDLFVAGMAGIEGNVYTDGAFIASSTAQFGEAAGFGGYVSTTAAYFSVMANNDSSNYFRFASVNSQPVQYFVSSTMANFAGFRLNSSTGELEYRDENEAAYTPFDSFVLGTGVSSWTDRGAYIDPNNATGAFKIRDTNGHTAIGASATTSDDYALGILETFNGVGVTGLQTGVSNTVAFTGSVGAGNYYFGAQGDIATWSGTAGDANDMLIGNAAQVYVTTTGGKTLEDVRAFYGYSRVSSGNVSSTYGVFGTSNNSGGLVDYAYGGYFSAEGIGDSNFGVRAMAEDGDHQYGGQFTAIGASGDDTYGISATGSSGDTTYGVYGRANGATTAAYGVYGEAIGNVYSAISYGYAGYFNATTVATTTIGVYAAGSGGTSQSFGVYAKGTSAGVFAENPDASDYTKLMYVSGGTTYGVMVDIQHTNAADAQGLNIGVTGSGANSGDLYGAKVSVLGSAFDVDSLAYGGYFDNTVTASTTYGVYANAENGGTNYGIYATASTGASYGVYAEASRAAVYAVNSGETIYKTYLDYTNPIGGGQTGIYTEISNDDSSSIYGLYSSITGAAGNTGNLSGVNSSVAGTIYSADSTAYGGYFNDLTTATTTYGIYTNAQNGGTNYGIYAAAPGTGGNDRGIYVTSGRTALEADNSTVAGMEAKLADINSFDSARRAVYGTVSQDSSALSITGGSFSATGDAGYTGTMKGVSGNAAGQAYASNSSAYAGMFTGATYATSTYGVYGTAYNGDNDYGVYGTADTGGVGTRNVYGVYGSSDDGYGIYAIGEPGLYARDYSDQYIWGQIGSNGVAGKFNAGDITYADGALGVSVVANSTNNVTGIDIDADGRGAGTLKGIVSTVTGSSAHTNDIYGMQITTAGYAYKVSGVSYGLYSLNSTVATSTYAVYGNAANGTSANYGVYGTTNDGTNGWGGYFTNTGGSMGLGVGDNLYVGQDSAADNDYIYFDTGLAYLFWDNANTYFSFSDSLSIGQNSAADDDYLYFDAGNEFLLWDNANSRFHLSDERLMIGDLSIQEDKFIYVSNTTEYMQWDNTGLSGPGSAFVFSDNVALNDNLYVGIVSSSDDDYIYMDWSGSTAYLEWQNTSSSFAFSEEIETFGTFIACNANGPDGDCAIDFYDAGVWWNEQLRWDDSSAAFNFTDDLNVNGTIMAGNGDGATPNAWHHFGNGTKDNANVTDANDVYISDDLEIDGVGYAASANWTVGDYAENMIVRGAIDYGELVVSDPANPSDVIKSTEPYQNGIVGAYSETPVWTIGNCGEGNESICYPISLAGRTKIKATNENGNIAIGDILTTADTDGYAMKATKPGQVIGVALGSLDTATGTVIVSMQPAWNSGGAIANDGTFGTFNDNFAFESTGTATSSTTAVNSFGLSFRGSGWDAVSSTARVLTMTILNEVSTTDEFGLAINNNDDEKVAYISNNGDLMISGRLYPSDRGAMQSDKYIFLDTSGGLGNYMRTNADGWATGSYDYAEMFYSDDGLTAGELVTVGTADESVARSASAYQNPLLGIVSTKPGFIAGEFATSTHPVALSGRVPTKVTNANGSIAIGDPITSSDIPGVGMKATANGPIVGYALEASDLANDTIILYVNPGWWNGGATSAIPGAEGGASGFPAVPGEVTYINGDLDITGHDLYGVKKIYGNGYKWEIDENGVVISRVETGAGQKEVFGITATQAEIIVSGSGITENGAATIEFTPEIIAMLSSTNLNVKVIVTPTSANTAGLAVTAKSSAGFTVTELNAGTGAVTFDWMLMAPRAGYERTLEDYIVNPASAAAPPEESGSSTEPIIPPEESGSSTEPIIP